MVAAKRGLGKILVGNYVGIWDIYSIWDKQFPKWKVLGKCTYNYENYMAM